MSTHQMMASNWGTENSSRAGTSVCHYHTDSTRAAPGGHRKEPIGRSWAPFTDLDG
jgi:hypothetical protein